MPALVEYGFLDDDAEHPASPSANRPDPQRIETARYIYNRLVPAAGTPAERYLRSRYITLPVPPIMRFGDVPHRLGGAFPAMVAPVVDINGALTGIHATFLRPDGSGKADFADPAFQRETRGVIRGGAIRLAPHEPNRELIVAEGVESALSATAIFASPAWSAVSAIGLKTVELPLAARRIVIATDNDISGTGQRNALAAYQRWSAEGRSVRIALPPIPGDDFNDVLRRGHDDWRARR
jgi:hypothetical protein